MGSVGGNSVGMMEKMVRLDTFSFGITQLRKQPSREPPEMTTDWMMCIVYPRQFTTQNRPILRC